MGSSVEMHNGGKRVFLWLLNALLIASCGATGGKSGALERSVKNSSQELIAIMRQDFNYDEGFTIAEDGYVHYIKQGETIWAIAQKYGISTADLIAINGIEDASKVEVGTRIYIPKESKNSKGSAEKVASTTTSNKEKGKKSTASGSFGDLCWPIAGGQISSRFGERWGKKHNGLDLPAPIGTTVRAAEAGEVILSENNKNGYGNLVIIKHKNDYFTVYAHNNRLLVKVGDKVKRCQKIAEAGSTGRSTGPHCHFEVREGKTPKDPLPFLEP